MPRQFSEVLVEFLEARDKVEKIKAAHPEAYDLQYTYYSDFDRFYNLKHELNEFFTKDTP